jgi:hypothetical protein
VVWEWRVYEGDTPLKAGFATSRETAQIDGDSALFRLLSAGQQSPPHQADAGELRRARLAQPPASAPQSRPAMAVPLIPCSEVR